MDTKAKAAPKAAAARPVAVTPQNRYLVRRTDGSVFIWTETLSKRKDLEEVYAVDVKAALEVDTLPDPRACSIQQIDAMPKDQLILFASVKLGLSLDGGKKKSELLLDVKEAIFSLPPSEEAGVETVKVDTTKPLSPHQARSQAGV